MPKLLIVDDESATVDMLATYLNIIGHDTVGAYSGEDGLVLAEAERPDLVILDLMMPDIQGFDVCQRLRASGKFENLPIVILSARIDQASIDKAMDSGADVYLTKPIDLPKLTSEIKRLLDNPPHHPGNGSGDKHNTHTTENTEDAPPAADTDDPPSVIDDTTSAAA